MAVAVQHFSGQVALQGGEFEMPFGVSCQNMLHELVAQAADAIEENHSAQCAASLTAFHLFISYAHDGHLFGPVPFTVYASFTSAAGRSRILNYCRRCYSYCGSGRAFETSEAIAGVYMSLSKILLVDDDDNIRAIAEISLEDEYQVTAVSSGAEALKMAQELAPDLILLDVMMPGMDGKSTFAKLQENPALASIPVIFMTAKVLNHEVDFYLGLGAAGVITKPFDPMTLSKNVQDIWSRCLK